MKIDFLKEFKGREVQVSIYNSGVVSGKLVGQTEDSVIVLEKPFERASLFNDTETKYPSGITTIDAEEIVYVKVFNLEDK